MSNNKNTKRMGPPPGKGMNPGEKPKDFANSITKLTKSIGRFKEAPKISIEGIMVVCKTIIRTSSRLRIILLLIFLFILSPPLQYLHFLSEREHRKGAQNPQMV